MRCSNSHLACSSQPRCQQGLAAAICLGSFVSRFGSKQACPSVAVFSAVTFLLTEDLDGIDGGIWILCQDERIGTLSKIMCMGQSTKQLEEQSAKSQKP